ncbi:MAG: peptidylprolyl isomerase [Treponema sp.]|jgi:FKBP-type peptidyl-prolyl cis-trans isomerase SlyD|nr:peptidylprolyl isomerase [Treponema sp.]
MNITKDKVVSIDYTLRDSKNNLLDSTSGAEPLLYLHGHENIIPGLERALEQKVLGDRIIVTVPAVEAYGERDDRLVVEVPLDRFEGVDAVKEGMQFEASTPDGYRMVTVTQVADTTITVDGNHPLAGMDLNFEVTVVDVRDARAEELEHGHVHSPQGHASCDECGGCGHHGCGG